MIRQFFCTSNRYKFIIALLASCIMNSSLWKKSKYLLVNSLEQPNADAANVRHSQQLVIESWRKTQHRDAAQWWQQIDSSCQIVLRKARQLQKGQKQRSDDSRSTAAAKLPLGRQHRRDSCRKGKSALWSLRTIAHMFPWWPYLLVLGHKEFFFQVFWTNVGLVDSLGPLFPSPTFFVCLFVALLFCAALTFDSMSYLGGLNDTHIYILSAVSKICRR